MGWKKLPAWPWETKAIGTPALNTFYVAYPSWRNVYVLLGYQAGVSHVDLRRGNSTYQLELCIGEGYCGGEG